MQNPLFQPISRRSTAGNSSRTISAVPSPLALSTRCTCIGARVNGCSSSERRHARTSSRPPVAVTITIWSTGGSVPARIAASLEPHKRLWPYRGTRAMVIAKGPSQPTAWKRDRLSRWAGARELARTNGARSVGDTAQSHNDAHAGVRNNGMTETTPNQTSEGEKTLSDYAGVLRRRRGIVLFMTILVPLIALVFSLRQSELYEGSAEVLLQRQDAVNALAGLPTQAQQDRQRYAETQAQLAESPQVGDRPLRADG